METSESQIGAPDQSRQRKTRRRKPPERTGRIIGERIVLARKAAGFKTAKAFAAHLGMKPGDLSRYENGWVIPSYAVILRFAEVLGVAETYFNPKRASADHPVPTLPGAEGSAVVNSRNAEPAALVSHADIDKVVAESVTRLLVEGRAELVALQAHLDAVMQPIRDDLAETNEDLAKALERVQKIEAALPLDEPGQQDIGRP